MNDSRYVNEIMMRLLSMAEGLLAASEKADVGMPELSLTPEEVEQVVDHLHDRTPTEVKGEASQ